MVKLKNIALVYSGLKILFITLVIGLSSNLSYAQTDESDSLRSALNSFSSDASEVDSSYINTLIDLAVYYRFTNPDSTFKYSKKAVESAQEIDFKRGFIFAQYLYAYTFFLQGDYDEVHRLANVVLDDPEAPNYPREYFLMNQLVGISHASKGDYELGLNYFLTAQELQRDLDNQNQRDYFQTLNNIGVSYFKLKEYQRALEYFEEFDSLTTLSAENISLPVNLGFIHYELGNLEEAERQLMRIMNFEGDDYDQRALGLSTFKLGEIYAQKGEFAQALDYFNQSIEVYEQYQNELEKVQSLNGIARTYLMMNEASMALDFAQEAFNIAQDNGGVPEKEFSSRTLYEAHKELGNYEQALTYLELHKNYSDSLLNEDVSREVGRLEAESEFREREFQLRAEQQSQNLENSQRVANRNILVLIAFSLFIIAVIFAYSQYRNSILRKKANNLLREKNKQIEEQAQRMEELNDIKTHLFSIISHDLRGPLSSLYGFITLNEMKEVSQDEINKMIPELADKFKYTSTLLNNLLNWSKSQLEGYKVIPESFKLKEQLTENIKVLSMQAQDKRILITEKVKPEIRVYADRNMISLVILNLISNAIKFTPEGGNIEIWTEEHGSSEIKFCIRDTGVGIKQDKLDLLFQETAFYTTDGTNHEKGTGLGLMLCQDFVLKNNGKIWAESELSKGSTFYFTLPKPS
jgi:signal transduction histidine kinase